VIANSLHDSAAIASTAVGVSGKIELRDIIIVDDYSYEPIRFVTASFVFLVI
jgi:hypothetical protein